MGAIATIRAIRLWQETVWLLLEPETRHNSGTAITEESQATSGTVETKITCRLEDSTGTALVRLVLPQDLERKEVWT
jgi:hypothetical protein